MGLFILNSLIYSLKLQFLKSCSNLPIINLLDFPKTYWKSLKVAVILKIFVTKCRKNFEILNKDIVSESRYSENNSGYFLQFQTFLWICPVVRSFYSFRDFSSLTAVLVVMKNSYVGFLQKEEILKFLESLLFK